jgi:hypothetical protein
MLTLAGLAACGGKSAETGAAPKPKPPVVPAVALGTYPISGEAVSVLPLTFLFFTDTTPPPPILADRAKSVLWADSIIGQELEARGPEVKWVLPPALRKIALRSPGVAADPDRMGQSIMRDHNYKSVPDPLRSSLRSMAALAGGRHVLIPAALIFFTVPDTGLKAELSMVMADTRTGDVVYRTLATGTGHTPEQALEAAMATVLPLDIDKR